MNDQPLPDFDFPPPLEVPAPRKPRPRPQKKRPAKKAAKRAPPAPQPAKRIPKKRRARKAVKQIVPVTHAGGLFTPEVYRAIGLLMEMKLPYRSLVLAIVDSLSGQK